MSTAAVFSVVVPCYGHARFVAHAIDSLWAQTVDAFEIIAVDDGSPDDTGEILDHLAAVALRTEGDRNLREQFQAYFSSFAIEDVYYTVIKDLGKHLLYVNVHTAKNPAGEIRGQVSG